MARTTFYLDEQARQTLYFLFPLVAWYKSDSKRQGDKVGISAAQQEVPSRQEPVSASPPPPFPFSSYIFSLPRTICPCSPSLQLGSPAALRSSSSLTLCNPSYPAAMNRQRTSSSRSQKRTTH